MDEPEIPANCNTEQLCYICSTDRHPVFHKHNSPKEIRIMQMVEYEATNLPYMCTSCVGVHMARPDNGVNICLSTSTIQRAPPPALAWLQ